MGGYTPLWRCPPRPSSPRLPIPHSLSPIPFVFTFFRTHLHFFALIKNSTLFFSSDSAHCVKKRPGVGLPLRFFSRTKMNRTRPNYSSIGGARCPLRRQPTRCVCSPRP